ncbi:right-handed parallel beta-helix repeat-containing protein, partial [bacterium]|nr:right-handed parallel beta-helix repeat-containing protein [candidate division CSSED10-310 bacterium]
SNLCTITGNVFKRNFRGVTVNQSAPLITNNLISGSVENGVGVWSWNPARPGNPTIINNTIFDNNYEGVYIWGTNASAEIRNNIIARNSNGITAMEGESIPPIVDYNCFWENGNTYTGDVTPGPNDISQDPAMTQQGRMNSGSPCIDQAEDAYAPDVDIDSESRPYNGQSDMGADEWIDTDGDGLPDWFETQYGDMTPDSDPDGDNLTAIVEYDYGTDPTCADTDGDGLTDDEEIAAGADGYVTDPTSEDTDGDGLEDDGVDLDGDGLTESGAGTSPVLDDTDNDGMGDRWEAANASCMDPITDDALSDADLDGADNWLECARGTDPCDNGSTPVVSTWHVDDDAPGDPGPGDPNISDPNEDGSSAHPFDYISEIIWNALDGDTILVHGGTYNENWLHMGRVLFLRAAPGETPVLNDTSINADPINTVLGKMPAGCISGFTLVNAGNSGNWAAVTCIRVRPGFEISDNLIYDSNPGTTSCGIAVNDTASPTIRNNRIAGFAQVGIQLYSSTATTTPVLVNNVIYDCGIASGWGRGIGIWWNVEPTLRNTIVTGNFRGVELSGPVAWTFSNNCISGNVNTDLVGCGPGLDDVDGDPMLVDPGNLDFRIVPGSPCLDAGTLLDVPAGDVDFEGEPRPDAITGLVDIGADEWHMVDTDADGMDDLWEANHSCMTVGMDDSGDDPDGDGFTNQQEYANGYLNPCSEDTDGDGLEDDGVDVNADGHTETTEGTDPNNPDSDGDGMPDGWEAENGLNPTTDDAGDDADNDGYTNYEEYMYGTDPQDDQAHPFFRWEQVADDGFDSIGNRFREVTVFDGHIYVGTDNPAEGAEIWRSADGESWEEVMSGGFGDGTNRRIQCMAVFKGYLYAGTRKNSNTLGGELWRSSDGVAWEPVAASGEPGAAYDDGFGDDLNARMFSMLAENNRFWIGTFNSSNGAEIWRSADGLAWERVANGGFGQAGTWGAAIYRCFGAYYATLAGASGGAQIWTSATGDSGDWSQVMSGGFGDADNGEVYLFGPFDGQLYGGTWNYTDGGELWQTPDGVNWTPLIADEVDPDDEGTDENGLGDPHNVSLTCQRLLGGDLWIMAEYNETDGASIWVDAMDDMSALRQASLIGWGDPANSYVIGPRYFDGYVYVVSYNWINGGEVHRALLEAETQEVPALSWLSILLVLGMMTGLLTRRNH